MGVKHDIIIILLMWLLVIIVVVLLPVKLDLLETSAMIHAVLGFMDQLANTSVKDIV